MKKSYIYLCSFACLLINIIVSNAYCQTNLWTHTKGPYGGNIYAIAVDSNDNFICSGTGGTIFRTTDKGQHWLEIGKAYASVNALTVNAKGHIFAGTDYPGAVVRSTDNGMTWEKKTNGLDQLTIHTLAVEPDGSILAGAGESWENVGLYRSKDNGDNWYNVPVVSTWESEEWVYSIAVSSKGDILLGTLGGVYLSTDSGSTFRRVCGQYIYAVAIAPSGYFVAASKYGDFYKSTDQGNTWKSQAMSCGEIHSIKFNSEGIGFAVGYGYGQFESSMGEGGIFRTVDDAKNWQRVETPVVGSMLLSLAIDREGNILVGSDGRGIFGSSDQSISWIERNDGLNAMNSQIAVTGDGSVYLGTHGAGVFQSSDGGNSWNAINRGLRNLYINSIVSYPKGGVLVATQTPVPLFAISDTGGVYFHSQDGIGWKYISENRASYLYNMVCTSQGTIYLVDNGYCIIRASSLDSPFTAVRPGFSNNPILSGAVSPSDHPYFGRVRGVEYSTDEGVSWILGPTPPDWVYSITFNKAGYVFAGCLSDGVMQSTDEGLTWKTKNVGLNSTRVTAMTTTSEGILIAGTDCGGVYKSTDDGEHWMNIGLQERSIISFSNSPDGILYATTRGGGLYRTITPITAVHPYSGEYPEEFSLSQNYPNPFNPATTISFSLPSKSFVSLKVFDALGREVSILVSEELPAGTYARQWNAATSSSGVYFYRLQAGTFIETKKLVILK
jgi:photosystem II stability/assembly factor-like uncharacterized protein